MIKIKVIKENERLVHIEVSGHAGFAESGKDIVCAAVSALTIGAVNSVELLLKVDLKPAQDQQNGGYLAWDIPRLDDERIDEQLQLLMKALVESLLLIEQEYTQYVRVDIETAQ